MNNEFAGRIALVTGAGGGIGAVIAALLAARGASVMIADMNEDGVAATVSGIEANGGSAASFVMDVTDPAQVSAMVDATVETYGGLHLAVNNAGTGGSYELAGEIDIAGWHRIIDVNLNGVFYGIRFEIPAILRSGGGAIVNMSSVLGSVGTPNAVPYTASKHGVTGLTKAAALGYADKGIRINSVHPGYIGTDGMKSRVPQEIFDGLVGLHPAGRLGEAAEVAEIVAFLLSERASFVTGAQYADDGGYSTR